MKVDPCMRTLLLKYKILSIRIIMQGSTWRVKSVKPCFSRVLCFCRFCLFCFVLFGSTRPFAFIPLVVGELSGPDALSLSFNKIYRYDLRKKKKQKL